MAYIEEKAVLNFYKAGSVLVFVLYISNVCSGHLLRHRLRTPCGGSTPSSGGPHITTPIPRASNILVAYRLWLAASDLTEAAQYLRRKYLQERIQSHALHDVLQRNLTLSGFPETSQLDTTTTFDNRLVIDFRRVSRAAVFIQQIKHDEEQSLTSPNYLRDYENLEYHIYPLLCVMKLAIRSQLQHVPYVDISDITMLTSHTGVSSTAQRYRRDYRILNASVRLFESIQSDYEFLRISTSSAK